MQLYFSFIFKMTSFSNVLIISLDGFSLSTYVVKEMSIIRLDGTYEHYFFAPPTPLSERSVYERKTIHYSMRHLGQVDWDDGTLPYSMVFSILKQLQAGVEVLCHGNMARNFLKKVLPASVNLRDTSGEGKKFPGSLDRMPCGRSHNGRYCSLAKGFYILDNFL